MIKGSHDVRVLLLEDCKAHTLIDWVSRVAKDMRVARINIPLHS